MRGCGPLSAASTVRAETYVGGVIDTDTTWDLGGSPYVVTVAAGGSIVVGNNATGSSYAGGIYFGPTSGGNPVTGNAIRGNSTNAWGRGIYFASGGNTLTDNTIENNTAGGEEGAVYLYNGDNNSFTDNRVRFNHTTSGQTSGVFITGGAEWLSLNGGADAHNIICYNEGYELYNNNTFYSGDGRHDIDAQNVFWGHRRPARHPGGDLRLLRRRQQGHGTLVPVRLAPSGR